MAVQVVASQLQSLTYNAAQSVGSATIAITGDYIGRGNARLAKAAAKLACWIVLAVVLVEGTFMITLRGPISRAFNDDVSIDDQIAALIPIVTNLKHWFY